MTSGKAVVAVGIALIIVLALFGGVFIPDKNGPETVVKMGFTDPEIKYTSIFFSSFKGCAEDDLKMWKIEATNPAGQRVEVTVCDGFLKSPTVRG
jgi:hypothetical protein